MKYFLVLIIILLPCVFSISVENVNVVEVHDSSINIKDVDLAKLDIKNIAVNDTSGYTFLVKKKDYPSISPSLVVEHESTSYMVFVDHNKDLETVIYLEGNQTYVDYLTSKMVSKKFVNDKNLANKKIIINSNYSNQRFGFSPNRGYYYDSISFHKPFTGFVVSYNNTIYLYGNSHVGIANAIQLLLDEEIRFLHSNHYAYIDDSSREGLKLWDIHVNGGDALGSLFLTTWYNVTATHNLTHRVRRMTTLLSSYYVNETIGPNSSSLIFAGGLWSNIDSSNMFAHSFVRDGYDVWQIELTGGPYTECSSCYNYDYDYLVDYAWPLMIGFIQNSTTSNLTYIAHSNGGRVALSSLDRWGASGRLSMAPSPVHHFIGMGIPGAFNGKGNNFANILRSNGDRIENHKNEHLTMLDSGVMTIFNVDTSFDNNKISKNLLLDYVGFMKDDSDVNPGFNISLEKFVLFYGDLFVIPLRIPNDIIVDNVDEVDIYNNINSTNKNIYLLSNMIHTSMLSSNSILNMIKGEMNG